MICYRDMTFCGFSVTCTAGKNCPRALTPKIVGDALFAGLDICQFTDAPDCYEVNPKNLHPDQEKLLALVIGIWRKYPSLRLLQLFGNVTGATQLKDIYFVGDVELYTGLLETYKEYNDLDSGHDAGREEEPDKESGQ